MAGSSTRAHVLLKMVYTNNDHIGVLYYAPLLFQQAGLSSSEASFLASGVSAIMIVAASVPATLLMDKWSRRASTVAGAIIMYVATMLDFHLSMDRTDLRDRAICMMSIGSLYASNSVHADYGAARWAVIVMIYVFCITYSASWAVGIKVYTSEIQPAKTRAAASSLAYSSNWVSLLSHYPQQAKLTGDRSSIG